MGHDGWANDVTLSKSVNRSVVILSMLNFKIFSDVLVTSYDNTALMCPLVCQSDCVYFNLHISLSCLIFLSLPFSQSLARTGNDATDDERDDHHLQKAHEHVTRETWNGQQRNQLVHIWYSYNY